MNLIKQSKIFLTIFILLSIFQCESKERFYRPDLPEHICAVGLIDIDDTLSYDICQDQIWPAGCLTCWVDTLVCTKKIYFEKSFQSDYNDGSGDIFRDFNFKISDDKEDIFVYNNDKPTRNPSIKIPADLRFESGRKYYFQASEKDSPDISAECIVPSIPPTPTLLSLKTGYTTLNLPLVGCYESYFDQGVSSYTRRFTEIEFSFTNFIPESYYALFLIATPPNYTGWFKGGNFASNFLNYELLETNTYGFFYTFKGGVTVQHFCQKHSVANYRIGCMTDSLITYFIDGSKIPAGNCIIKISTQWDYVQYIPSVIEYFHVRLMSIPKEAYLFYKSLYTYKIQHDDPFEELININGNIVGGNGVIALCRSRDLIVYTGQTGGMFDPYF